MDKPPAQATANRFLAALLMGLLAVMYKEMVWDTYFSDEAPAAVVQQGTPQQAAITPTPSTTPGVTPAVPGQVSAPTAQVTPEGGKYPSDEQIEANGFVRVVTNKFDAKISLLGGRLASLRLLDYTETKGKKSKGYDLVRHGDGAAYPLGVHSGSVDDSSVLYRLTAGPAVDGSTFTVKESEQQFVLEGVLPDGRAIKKAVAFKPDGYLFDVMVSVDGLPAGGGWLQLDWTRYFSPEELEGSLRDPYKLPLWTWYDDAQVKRLYFNEYLSAAADLSREKMPKMVRWLTLGDKYFAAGLISKNATLPGEVFSVNDLYSLKVSGGEISGNFTVFAGPKSFELLESVGWKFDRNIDFGFFELFAAPMLSLLHFFNALFGNYALAIVMLTILVKALTYPLNAASFRSMKKMQDLAPEIKRMQETITDKNLQRQKMMELYQKRGVNPMGGCLPMFIQMPIFFGLYVALQVAVELRHSPFCFWIQDLSEPEYLSVFGWFHLPVMVILMVISMLVQQWYTPSTMDPMQKKIMLLMPLFMGFLFAAFPAGLTLYWLTNNLISISQQRVFYSTKVDNKQGFVVTLVISGVIFAFTALLVALG